MVPAQNREFLRGPRFFWPINPIPAHLHVPPIPA